LLTEMGLVGTVLTWSLIGPGGCQSHPAINSDKHLPQSPSTGLFFQMRTFCIYFYESYLSTPTLVIAARVPAHKLGFSHSKEVY
jgi:hypothetical protein